MSDVEKHNEDIEFDPKKFGIKTNEDGQVEIHFGGYHPFEIPPATAIMMAMLLLKHAGVEFHSQANKAISRAIEEAKQRQRAKMT